MFVVGHLLRFRCCWLFVVFVSCVLIVVVFYVFVFCCLLCVVCCVLFVVCCVLFVVCWLLCCLLYASIVMCLFRIVC